MVEIKIRRPQKEELESINDFFEMVLIDTFDKNGISDLKDLLEEEIEDKRRCINQDFNSNGSERFFLLAEYKDEIIGTIEYGKANELLNECTNHEFEHLLEIGTVFVHPQYQRQGIVSKLLSAMFRELSDKSVEEVCFDSGYPIAQEIWCKKFGPPSYYLEDYWGEGAHHMVWNINVKKELDLLDLKNVYLEMEAHLQQDVSPSNYFNRIYDTPIFHQYPFTMLYELKQTNQSPKYHSEGNVWNHTMLVVDEAAKRKEQSKNQSAFMWAALLHDIGKPSTTKVRKGSITSYNHDTVGAKMAREFLMHFTEEKDFIDEICGLIQYHMQILFFTKGHQHGDMEKMKKQVDVHEIALLGLCDRLGRGNSNPEAERNNINQFLDACGSDKRL